MKKWTKVLTILSFAFIAMLMVVGCSKDYDFYKDWHEAGAEIEKENIFEVISLDDAKKKKENNDVFVLVYASSMSDSVVNNMSVSLISSLQAQAEYLGNTDATIYFLDSKEFDTKEKRKTVRESLNMHDALTGGDPVLLVYGKLGLEVDTSSKNGSNGTKSKEFLVNGSYSYPSLASYIFTELLVK